VVAGISAWNFPLVQAVWKLGPAVAAGCTIVLKPAEQAPLSAVRLAELVVEAGFPPGVVNVCPGMGSTAGAALVAHPLVEKVSFTGSLGVGRLIARQAADTLKHVSLELGGKNPHVIFADADMETAIEAAAAAIFFNSGQACGAGSRLFVERSVHDEVVAGVVEAAGKLRLGIGMDPETDLGPLVSDVQRERVLSYIDAGEQEGSRLALRSEARPAGDLERGFFVGPTVFTDVPDDSRIAREEIFGPVLVVHAFDQIEDLMPRANRNEYGLAAGVWTSNLAKAHTVAARLEAGTVWINSYNYYDPATPWGGFKQSGIGREVGRLGLEKHLQTKTVWAALT
jgi:acyl-CoA reductase-like NAD-dependent aldehyde dehydrogenase